MQYIAFRCNILHEISDVLHQKKSSKDVAKLADHAAWYILTICLNLQIFRWNWFFQFVVAAVASTVVLDEFPINKLDCNIKGAIFGYK